MAAESVAESGVSGVVRVIALCSAAIASNARVGWDNRLMMSVETSSGNEARVTSSAPPSPAHVTPWAGIVTGRACALPDSDVPSELSATIPAPTQPPTTSASTAKRAVRGLRFEPTCWATASAFMGSSLVIEPRSGLTDNPEGRSSQTVRRSFAGHRHSPHATAVLRAASRRRRGTRARDPSGRALLERVEDLAQGGAMVELPSGTVTFLFTDVEGSTRLWEEHPDAMQQALARHDEIVRAAISAHHGYVVKTTGDGFHAAFSTALDAIGAA